MNKKQTSPTGHTVLKSESKQEDAASISEFQDELSRLSRRLTEISGSVNEGPVSFRPAIHHHSVGRLRLLKFAKYLYNSRRRRTRFIKEKYLGEPGWDILLDLYIADEEKRNVSVSSASLASAVPATTGLRWATAFEEAGLVKRRPHPSDERASLLSLSPEINETVRQYLEVELQRLAELN